MPTMPPLVSASSTRMLRASPKAWPFSQGLSGHGTRNRVVRMALIVVSVMVGIRSSVGLVAARFRLRLGSGQRIALFGGEALRLRQPELFSHDIGAEHHCDHLVAGVAAPHPLAAHPAIGRNDQPLRRNMLERLAEEGSDLVGPFALKGVMVNHAD